MAKLNMNKTYQIYGIETGKKRDVVPYDLGLAKIVKARAEIMYNEKCVIVEKEAE